MKTDFSECVKGFFRVVVLQNGDIALAKSKYIMVNRVLLVRDVSCAIFVGGGKNMSHPSFIFYPSLFGKYFRLSDIHKSEIIVHFIFPT